MSGGWRRAIALAAGVAFATVALSTAALAADGSTSNQPAPPGSPPEIAANLTAFPAPMGNYTNDRTVAGSRITSENIGSLRRAWTTRLRGEGAFGLVSANPIVTSDTVYLQDMNSNVLAVDRGTGATKWTRRLNSATIGPNGVALGDGRVYGATTTRAFALDAATGRVLWRSPILPKRSTEGIDMAPVAWGGLVYVSTVPGRGIRNFYRGGARGVMYALDGATGRVVWSFNTTTNNLWGNPDVNSGGGSWYPPAIDSQGRIYYTVANPAPFPGTKRFPNGTSRPGANLYTNTLIAADARTGRMLWHYQAIPHDFRDHDLQLPAILATFTINGAPRDVVVTGGKMGTVYVNDRATGQLVWKRDVGRHNKWGQPGVKFPLNATVTMYPGLLGGVETPMAVSDGVIYVPVNNVCARMINGASYEACEAGTGELVALDGATGRQLWKRDFPSSNYGGATVVNDLVLTSTLNRRVYALNRATGQIVWQQRTSAGINATPAVTENEIFLGAGSVAGRGQRAQLYAWRLP